MFLILILRVIFLFLLFPFPVYSVPIDIVTEESPPLQYFVNGKLDGRTTRIVKAVLEQAGLDGEFRVYPWARAYNIALNSKNTLIYSIL